MNHNRVAILKETKTINVQNNKDPKELILGAFLTYEEEEQFTQLLNKINEHF